MGVWSAVRVTIDNHFMLSTIFVIKTNKVL
jgi:hypothetical protein